MTENSTHFIFDSNKVLISPDLRDVIIFLQEIKNELEVFLNFEKKLESIKKQHLETLNFIEELAKKLRENSINFQYNLSEHPQTIVEKLNIIRPIRSEMIALFANLETLFCLDIAYNYKTSDEKTIINLARDQNFKKFVSEFCLNEENNWCKKNIERLKHITPDDFRKLRNSLTHFFSVSKGLGISYPLLDEKSRKLEKATKYKAKFISPEDLYEILKGAALLIIIKWSSDCTTCLEKNSNDFNEKISAVKDIVYKSGVIIINNEQINI